MTLPVLRSSLLAIAYLASTLAGASLHAASAKAQDWVCNDPSNQVGPLEECLAVQLSLEEAELTTIASQLLKNQPLFARSQATWNEYRTSHCAFEATQELEGESTRLAELDCRLEMTQERAENLRKRL